ncbi:response regulator transcription factor [Cohnella zeiphila]|uniref:Response regulator n=1 Tax=Cohnella zeiphila TaxID=2761120 RepID=A0A7X0SK45_9BACL|nr:response regulator [Cohnella zeiphila]MBB6731336.1 response regulator [Cohnella zeiphila]
MYRLLIIDDEPIIVNGLHEYFRKSELADVEIVLAYSAAEAISQLDSAKIDVVLSDICMPEMSGMELLGQIEKRWPRCKVILLTGHDEFEYAHQALRSSCVVDYILKTEGMGKIGSAVKHAFALVKDELSVYRQKEWLQKEFPKVMNQLQRQLLLDLLRRTDREAYLGLQDEFDALKLPFRAGRPVLPILLSVEEWGKYETTFERNLMLFSVGNIAEELLGSRTVTKFVPYDHSTLLGLVQSPEQTFVTEEKQSERTANFTFGTLESVQQVCRDLFHIPLSAATSNRVLPFEDTSQEIRRLRLAVLNGQARGLERLLVVKPATEQAGESTDHFRRQSAQYALEQLKQRLLGGTGSDWTHYFDKLTGLFPPSGPEDPFDRMVILQNLSEHCLVCLEELGLKNKAISQTDLPRILQFNSQVSWGEAVVLYQSLFEWMQCTRNDHLKREESHLIGRIYYYIHNNLDSDLSLTRIAREVSLNPSYLSRWYKQVTGQGLSDYIQEVKIEKGKELLASTSYRIHEISEKLGFTDPHYFFRFFKKVVGCTPQDYRNRKV